MEDKEYLSIYTIDCHYVCLLVEISYGGQDSAYELFALLGVSSAIAALLANESSLHLFIRHPMFPPQGGNPGFTHPRDCSQ